MLADAGFGDLGITAAMIEDALKSGDVEDILLAASRAMRLAGDADAADFLAGAAQIIYGIENEGDIAQILSGVFRVLGDKELAGFFGSLAGLDKAIEDGDIMAALKDISSMAKYLGYSGLAQITGVASVFGGAFSSIMDLDNALDVCQGRIPWDLICTVPDVGGGVCPQKHPVRSDCSFDVGLPSFDAELLCNDLLFDLGFQIDCTCVYTCVEIPNVWVEPVSVGVNLKYLAMMLDPDQYLDALSELDMSKLLLQGDILNYCRLDP
jgi:hypothetical protein